MGIVVDLIIIAVVLLFILLGYRKGLTGSLIKLLSFIIAVVISLVFYKPLANILIDNTQIDENIKASMTETFIHEQETETDEEKNMPSTILDSINKDIENATETAKKEAVDATTITIIRVASIIVLFLIVRILLIIVGLFANQITKLPVIRQADKIGGVVYGAVEGMVIVYMVLGIISLASVIWSDNILITAITKSALGEMLYNNNIILKILFK